MPSSVSLLLLLPPFVEVLRLVGIPTWWSVVGASTWAWVWRGLFLRQFDIRPTPLYWLLGALGGIVFFSISSPLGDPILKLYRAFSFCALRLLVVFFLVNGLRRLEDVRRALRVLVGLGVISAVVAIVQFLAYQRLGANLSFAEGDQMFRVTAVGTFLRATAFTRDPNIAATLMAVLAVWCAWLATDARGSGKGRRLAAGACYITLAAGVYVAFSRSALLSLVLLTLAVPLLRHPRRAGRILAVYSIGFAVLLGMGGLEGLSDIVFGETLSGLDFRADLFALGIRGILEYPVTGVGVDSFYSFDNPLDAPVHNLLLQAAAETGLAGLMILLAILASVAGRLQVAVSRAPQSPGREMGTALLLGFGAMLMAYMGGPFFLDAFLWIYIGLMEAATLALRADGGEEYLPRRLQPARRSEEAWR